MNVCITGASRGVGRALANKLALEGHSVWGVSRDAGTFFDIGKSLSDASLFFSTADVSDREAVSNVKQEMDRAGFIPDVIFLCAGILKNDITPDSYERAVADRTMGVNFYGALNFVDAFLPFFLARGSGRFVAISSTTVLRPTNGGVAYPASKAALSSAFRTFDLFYRTKGVIFSTVYLGPVSTELLGRKPGFFVSTAESVAESLKRVLTGKKAVYFIPGFIRLLFWLPPAIPDIFFVKFSAIIKGNRTTK